jgi:uncharacterized iron-regulated membrane protein
MEMFRKFLLWLHLVAGLAAAIVLVLLGVTGAVMVFEGPLDHALNAKLYRVAPQGPLLGLDELVAKVEQSRPGSRAFSLGLPPAEDLAATVSLRGSDGKSVTFTANPYTGEILGSLATASTFVQKLHTFHKNLLLGPTGKTITLWGALLLIVLALTGIVLWWPRKIWKLSDMKPGRRANFDLHNALGFWSSIFMLIFAFTGVVIHWDNEAMQWVGRITHTPPTLTAPKPKLVADATLVGPQALFNAATQAVPGARVRLIMGFGGTHEAVRVLMRYPEDYTQGGRTNVFLDPATGAVLLAQTSRDAPIGYRLVSFWNRQLHTGDTLGWPSRIIACLTSLSLPLLALTGPLIWWGKFKRRRRGEVD